MAERDLGRRPKLQEQSKRHHIVLPARLEQQLRELSTQEGIPMAEFARYLMKIGLIVHTSQDSAIEFTPESSDEKIRLGKPEIKKLLLP